MASLLPPISEVSKKSKRRKTELSSLVSAYQSVRSINLQEHNAKIPNEMKEWWLIARFGFQCVSKVCHLVHTIPFSLTNSQKKELLLKLCGLREEDVEVIATFILEHDLFHQGDQDNDKKYPQLLAPPLSSCTDCGRKLVSHHTTNVRSLLLASLVYWFTQYQ